MAVRCTHHRALVVLPTYNEVDNIASLVESVLQFVPQAEIVVVDDASPDGTGELVEKLRRQEPRIHLLGRSAKMGLGSAYLAGFRFGLERDHDLLVTMDADLAHDPAHLPELLSRAQESSLVIGSRYVPGGGFRNWPLSRRLLSTAANLYARLLLGLDVRDCTSGYRCYQREALLAANAFEIRSSGYSFLYELLAGVAAAGLPVTEVPIVFVQRTAGRSKINSSEIFIAIWRVLVAGLRARRRRGPAALTEVARAQQLERDQQQQAD